MKKTEIVILVFLLTLAILGCYHSVLSLMDTVVAKDLIHEQEIEIVEPAKWGQGDPSADWQENFGNGNLSRFNYYHVQKTNQQGIFLAELADRVRKLEDPNE